MDLKKSVYMKALSSLITKLRVFWNFLEVKFLVQAFNIRCRSIRCPAPSFVFRKKIFWDSQQVVQQWLVTVRCLHSLPEFLKTRNLTWGKFGEKTLHFVISKPSSFIYIETTFFFVNSISPDSQLSLFLFHFHATGKNFGDRS